MINNINWPTFESRHENVTKAFEDLTRLFFKYKILENRFYTLKKTATTPGIEVEPVLSNGIRISFQSKYFTGNISYNDIYDSAKKIIKYYKNKIDKVILFCNKDISSSAKTYIKTVELLKKNNILLEPFCNDNILDEIKTNSVLENLKKYFFEHIVLSDSWFEEKLKDSLLDLEPRYTSELHVPIREENVFHSIYKNKKIFSYINSKVTKIQEYLKLFYDVDKKVLDDISAVIDSFPLLNRDTVETVFTWYTKFNSAIKKINELVDSIANDIKNLTPEYDKNSSEISIKRELYYKYQDLLNIIEEFNFANDFSTKYLNNKIFFVEGDAGYGKSHLLGYIAELNGITKESRTLLFLGSKFINDDQPKTQMMDMLGDGLSFETFIQNCEIKGEIDGTITVIMIDAINECSHNTIWKNYLNEIIRTVQKCNFVRLICSVRTTYKDIILNENILIQIKNKELPLICIKGFRHNLFDAIPKFFEHYKIPISSMNSFLNYEFENPLFLKMFCETYGMQTHKNTCYFFSIYQNYLLKEEEKIKEKHNLDYPFSCVGALVKIIGKFFYENNIRYIPYDKLMALASKNNISDYKVVINGLIKSKVLVSYQDNEKINIYINYEKFEDFIVAKYIIGKYQTKKEFRSFVEQTFYRKRQITPKIYSTGIFVALATFASEEFGIELLPIFKNYDTGSKKINNFNRLICEYIESLTLRSDESISRDNFLREITPFIKTKKIFETCIDTLIKLSCRNCQLNAIYLHEFLYKMALPKRDYFWTIYINSHYCSNDIIYNTINFAENFDLNKYSFQNKKLCGLILIWFLTSSNRTLRDHASRAIIKLLKSDFLLSLEYLKAFINVNDSYVISRLFACVYGALLQVNINNEIKNELVAISDFIYENVFKYRKVYPDILLRDYALNILEFINYKKIKINFDIKKCRPPYFYKKIPTISTATLEKKYHANTKNYKKRGTNLIRDSLTPEFRIGKLCNGLYGDFGRYIFNSALNYFDCQEKEKIFKYAYFYILDTLKYNNSYFTEYDYSLGYGRGRKSPIERIGKKYEWMAFYHIMSLVSDLYKFKGFLNFGNRTFLSYKGTWDPFVRDFDPTLNIKSSTDVYNNLQDIFSFKKFNKWGLKNDKWASVDDLFNFTERIRIVDNHGEMWTALWFYEENNTGNNYNIERQNIYRYSTACIIKKEELKNFVRQLKNKNLWGRWLNAAEIQSFYNIFLREYYWSPAFKQTVSNSFKEAKIRCKSKETKSKQHTNGFSNIFLKTIGHILPLAYFYRWETEYDYAKDSTITITLPNKNIVSLLNLKMRQDGIWTIGDGNEIVCIDLKYVRNCYINGLYIKEKYLKTILSSKYDIVWVGFGEKQHTFGYHKTKKQYWSEISSLVFKTRKNNFKEINLSDHKCTE